MDGISIALIVISALAGGVLNALLGWLKSDPPEPFNIRKFASNFLANIFGAAVIAVGFNYSGITNIWLACLGALIAGAGAVSAAKNITGTFDMKVGKGN